MKKLILLTLLLLFVPLVSASYNDDFEASAGTYMNNYLNWTESASAGTAQIITDPTDSGNTAGGIALTSSSTGNFVKLNLAGESQTITSDSGVVAHNMYLAQSGTQQSYFMRYGIGPDATNYGPYFQIIRDGVGWKFVNQGTGTDTIVSGFSDSTWFYIEIFPNLTSDTYTLSVDGVNYNNSGSGYPFVTTISSLTYLNFDDNGVADLRPLTDLTSIRELHLDSNGITDLQALVDNPGLSTGDILYIRYNRLSTEAIRYQVPALVNKGVIIYR